MKVKQIYTYPIKSIRGCSLPSLPAMYQGFAHDRRFMLLRASDQQNMHVSGFPEMCLFTTEVTLSSLSASDGQVIVTFNPPTPNEFSPTHISPSSISLPLQPSTDSLEEVEVTMHSSPTVGFDMGKKYDEWFSERFGYGVILVYIGKNRREILGNMPPNVAGRQQQSQGNALAQKGMSGNSWMSSITSSLPSIPIFGAKEEEAPGVDEGISFADCAPYLVISTKSWENAQNRLPDNEQLEISKFRPNIIVEGADSAFDEDYWAEIEIGSSLATPDADDQKENEPVSSGKPSAGARIVLTQNCARCTSLNVDYKTGKFGVSESGKILKKLQSDRRVDMGAKYSPIFGRYGFLDRVPGSGGVEIRVGDEVRVSKRNAARTRFEWPNLSTN